MDKKEIVEMCRVIFTHAVNSEISTTMVTKMVEFAKNGKIPFKALPQNEDLLDNMIDELGVLELEEFKIYNSISFSCLDGEIEKTRYLRLTKGEGENMRELCIEL